jgi:hypothetical protein
VQADHVNAPGESFADMVRFKLSFHAVPLLVSNHKYQGNCKRVRLSHAIVADFLSNAGPDQQTSVYKKGKGV